VLLAAQNPERVNKLVIFGGNSFITQEVRRGRDVEVDRVVRTACGAEKRRAYMERLPARENDRVTDDVGRQRAGVACVVCVCVFVCGTAAPRAGRRIARRRIGVDVVWVCGGGL
jgi:hypothetical protein